MNAVLGHPVCTFHPMPATPLCTTRLLHVTSRTPATRTSRPVPPTHLCTARLLPILHILCQLLISAPHACYPYFTSCACYSSCTARLLPILHVMCLLLISAPHACYPYFTSCASYSPLHRKPATHTSCPVPPTHLCTARLLPILHVLCLLLISAPHACYT
jgi:hypothetical protein